MPLLMLGVFVFQLERGNISYAITSTFFADVGFDQNHFNTASLCLRRLLPFADPSSST
ncbi:hypothetical protein BCR35DRAFT_335222 [Leucosporidium creatinivorum]|uniref:Major facilitator superfamily (MFS) profile domain-containing protein n=1 Tax=Leucosporidium creatinivorum TaxID=106004 RepID=A0A1Y2DFD1_9BASI|nr:hypothetical protein BCR35DRAFT_335222 [Leucosporidium creatinivorum]